MELSSVAYGLMIATQPGNLLYALLGAMIGSVVGVLPGLGPLVTMALLLPLTYGMDPTGGLILLAGIYYGAMYGGSTTSIMMKLPGENASVVTTFDGYPLRLQGRGGVALAIAAFASFTAGMLAVGALAFMAVPMTKLALKLGVAESFVLMSVALALVSVLVGSSVTKGLIMTLLGLFASLIGTDLMTGRTRFTMGFGELAGGLELVPVVVGLFAIGEVLHVSPTRIPRVTSIPLRSLIPTRRDWTQSILPTLRGSGLGLFLGILPGAGPSISSYLAYGVERAVARDPSRFGKGAIEGVAAPEAANNAASTGAFIPLLTLGIPGSPSAAVLLTAFILYGLQPGPALFAQTPDIAWGLICSMFVGNVMLLFINLPLAGMFIQLLRVPFPVISLMTVLLALLGSYSVNVSLFEVWVALAFGAFGLAARRLDYPIAPFVLAYVLGGGIETSFRQLLLLSDLGVFVIFTRPASLTMIVITALSIGWVAVARRRSSRREIFDD